jgi:hypothetical protein
VRQSSRPTRGQSGLEDSEVPPAVTCAACRRIDCPGCVEVARALPVADGLSWESAGGPWTARLWSTALASSSDPQRTFGLLREGALGPALAFALIAEVTALGSLGLLVALLGFLIAPALVAGILGAPAVVAFCAGLVLGSSLIMVGLHLVWGLCVELGARCAGGSARFRQGMRFGLYACGWDLLTSPAGVVQGLVSRGWQRAWGPIVAAVRVPRSALRAYTDTCRQLGRDAQRRGNQLSVMVLGSLVLLIVGLVVEGLLRFLSFSGY